MRVGRAFMVLHFNLYDVEKC